MTRGGFGTASVQTALFELLPTSTWTMFISTNFDFSPNRSERTTLCQPIGMQRTNCRLDKFGRVFSFAFGHSNQ